MATTKDINGTVFLDGSATQADLYLIDLAAISPVAQSDAGDGSYNIHDPGDGSVIPASSELFVVCRDQAGTRPLVHGPITPLETDSGAGPTAVLAWGSNAASFPLPADFGTDSGVVAVSVGGFGWSAVREDGLVLTNTADIWGDPLTVPAILSDGSTVFTQAVSGAYHALALKDTGEVIGWGGDSSGQLTIPTAAQSGATFIAVGESNSWAITSAGELIGWGDTWLPDSIPAEAASGMVKVSPGSSFVVALTDAGKVLAFGGSNNNGETSLPSGLDTGVVDIAAGGSHGLALKDTGEVVAWGDDGDGQATVPVEAQSGVAQIAAGGNTSYAITDAGDLIVWGENAGETIPSGGDTGLIQIAASAYFVMALKQL